MDNEKRTYVKAHGQCTGIDPLLSHSPSLSRLFNGDQLHSTGKYWNILLKLAEASST